MTKYEFLYALRDTLANALTPSQVEEHIQYYTRYIEDQISLGYSEAQVLSELGEPRSIAHNIIDGIEEAGNASYGSQNSNENYQSETFYSDGEPVKQNIGTSKLKSYAIKAGIIIVVFAVLIAVSRLIIWALPTIITVAVIMWIFKKLNGR